MKTIENYYYHLDVQERNARGFEPGQLPLQSSMKPIRLSEYVQVEKTNDTNHDINNQNQKH